MEQERRRYPRVNYYLPLKISSTDTELVTETKNISLHGVYCLVSRDIALMTKFKIIMHVPAVPRQAGKKFHKIECVGVVVRGEPVKNLPEHKEKMFGVGIFFSEIKERDRKYLERFIEYCLSHPDPAA